MKYSKQDINWKTISKSIDEKDILSKKSLLFTKGKIDFIYLFCIIVSFIIAIIFAKRDVNQNLISGVLLAEVMFLYYTRNFYKSIFNIYKRKYQIIKGKIVKTLLLSKNFIPLKDKEEKGKIAYLIKLEDKKYIRFIPKKQKNKEKLLNKEKADIYFIKSGERIFEVRDKKIII